MISSFVDIISVPADLDWRLKTIVMKDYGLVLPLENVSSQAYLLSAWSIILDVCFSVNLLWTGLN